MRGDLIESTIAAIRPPDEAARDAALALQATLTKPAGALGRLEDLHAWAAGVLGAPAPDAGPKVIVVAAADHGVARRGVSAYPQDVTAQMVRNLLDGGAAVNVLAAHAGADVRVVDCGVLADIDDPRLHVAKVRRRSDDLADGPAMTVDEARTLVEQGIAFARDLPADVRVVGLGDMGIGNTTPAAALTSALTGAPATATAGRGTGIDDSGYAAKLAAVERASERARGGAGGPLDVLAEAGGFEIAFLVGVALGAASRPSAVILDGYPTTAAALVAGALAPECVPYMLASHASTEPGHRVALAHLVLEPLLDLRMRLGEGTGAALAMSLLDAALRIPHEMATFASAGVSTSTAAVRPEA